MTDLGKLLLVLGGVIIIVGAVLLLAGKFDVPLGRLPGDIVYRGKNTAFLFSSDDLYRRQPGALTYLLAAGPKPLSIQNRFVFTAESAKVAEKMET